MHVVLFLWLLLWPRGTAADDPVRLLERRIFDAVNRERRTHGIKELAWDQRIAQAARRHSTNMTRGHFFSHRDPRNGDTGTRLKAAGIPWISCAENLYQDTGSPDPVRSAIQSWLSSAGHRRNLLDQRYTRTGIGVSLSNGHTITQIFVARPRGGGE
jgi:uncharacterized protein YkwD